jgi:hypothetical protein
MGMECAVAGQRETPMATTPLVACYSTSTRVGWECHEREARFMPKFIKLLTDDEEVMLVNLETVTRIKDRDEEGLTAIYFIGSEHPLRVKESGQEILKRAKAEW